MKKPKLQAVTRVVNPFAKKRIKPRRQEMLEMLGTAYHELTAAGLLAVARDIKALIDRATGTKAHTCPTCGGETKDDYVNVTAIKSRKAWAAINLSDEQISGLARGVLVLQTRPWREGDK